MTMLVVLKRPLFMIKIKIIKINNIEYSYSNCVYKIEIVVFSFAFRHLFRSLFLFPLSIKIKNIIIIFEFEFFGFWFIQQLGPAFVHIKSLCTQTNSCVHMDLLCTHGFVVYTGNHVYT